MTIEETINSFEQLQAEWHKLLHYSEVIDTAINTLAKVRDGRMIELPCKVGDTVYCILFSPKYDKLIVAEGFVESFKIGETICARVLDCEAARYANVDITVKISEFGKTVFLTREEAEKALKERETK